MTTYGGALAVTLKRHTEHLDSQELVSEGA